MTTFENENILRESTFKYFLTGNFTRIVRYMNMLRTKTLLAQPRGKTKEKSFNHIKTSC